MSTTTEGTADRATTWTIDWRGEQLTITSPIGFYPREVAESSTDLPIDDAGIEGPHPDFMPIGASTWLVATTREPIGHKSRHLRWRITRTA